MTDRSLYISAAKKPAVILGVVGGLVVILIWLFSFYFPYSTKVSNDNAQSQALLTQKASLEAQVRELQNTQVESPQLLAKLAEFNTLIPDNSNPYPYITTIDNAATNANVTIVGLTAAGPATLVPGTQNISSIPIPVMAKGTYDSALAFIKSIYALPRLTSIDSVQISGGGPGSNRATILSVNLDLTIYTTAPPSPAS